MIKSPTITYNAPTNTLQIRGGGITIQGYELYKVNGHKWDLVTTVSTTAGDYDLDLTGLLLGPNTITVMTVGSDGATKSVPSNTIYVVAEEWYEASNLTVFGEVQNVTADTLRKVNSTLNVNLDTNRKVVNSVAILIDSVRKVVNSVTISVDTNRKVINPITILVDTNRKVANLIDILVDTVRKVVKSGGEIVNVDTLRKIIKQTTVQSDTNRIKTKTIQILSDSLRYVSNYVQVGSDTLRQVISGNIQIINVDTIRNVIKSVSIISDTKRKISILVEIWVDTFRAIKIINLIDLKPKFTFFANKKNFIFKTKERVKKFIVKK